MSQSREKLVKELVKLSDIYSDNEEGTNDLIFESGRLADFILARDRKIVEPLVKYNESLKDYPSEKRIRSFGIVKAINETLKLAGVL